MRPYARRYVPGYGIRDSSYAASYFTCFRQFAFTEIKIADDFICTVASFGNKALLILLIIEDFTNPSGVAAHSC
jgi:hypothetical protein